jgi:hypothetical protein
VESWLRTGKKQRYVSFILGPSHMCAHINLPSKKNHKHQILFMKHCLSGYEANWTEVKRINQRGHHVPRPNSGSGAKVWVQAGLETPCW